MAPRERPAKQEATPNACLTEEALARSFSLCPRCGSEGEAHRAKLVCPVCRIPIMTCCD